MSFKVFSLFPSDILGLRICPSAELTPLLAISFLTSFRVIVLVLIPPSSFHSTLFLVPGLPRGIFISFSPLSRYFFPVCFSFPFASSPLLFPRGGIGLLKGRPYLRIARPSCECVFYGSLLFVLPLLFFLEGTEHPLHSLN